MEDFFDKKVGIKVLLIAALNTWWKTSFNLL